MSTAKKPFWWFRQVPSEFIAGVSGMPAEYIGVYSVLYNLMYARRRKLETRARRDDLAGLARICGVSTRRFGQILAELLVIPNKITMDDEGRLSNPRFERWLEGIQEKGEGEQTGEQISEIFEEKKSTKTSRKDDEKKPQKQATLFGNKDLAQKKPASPRARARPESQKLDKIGNAGGSAAGPQHPTAEHTMTSTTFEVWVAACRRTIPRGWSQVRALKRWVKLPSTPVQDLIDAWSLYIADNREKSKNAKFPHRTMFPENWFKDRIFESYLEDVERTRETQRHAEAARQKRETDKHDTIKAWNGKAQPFIARIGERKFDLCFVPSTLVETSDGYEVDFGPNDNARSEAEQFHGDDLRTLLGRCKFTSNRKRESEQAFQKRKAAP